jgi:hypothetical protein
MHLAKLNTCDFSYCAKVLAPFAAERSMRRVFALELNIDKNIR